MLHLRLVRHHTKKLVGLALVGLICWVIIAGFSTAASGPSAQSGANSGNDTPGKGALDISITTTAYRQTNLVSDSPGVAKIHDPNLVNPWGVTLSGTSPFWVADNGKAVSSLYSVTVTDNTPARLGLVVSIPGPSGGGAPNRGGLQRHDRLCRQFGRRQRPRPVYFCNLARHDQWMEPECPGS